jgi:hypothetical protein
MKGFVIKKLFVIIFINFLAINVYCQYFYIGTSAFSNGEYIDTNGHTFTFNENARINGFKNGKFETGLYDGSYSITEEEGINYLLVLWDDGTRDKYLLIAGEGYLYLYNSNSEPFFFSVEIPPDRVRGPDSPYEPPFAHAEALSATSVLREGDTIYGTENLDEKIGVCWAEGVEGQGVGEKLIFELDKINEYFIFDGLYISIGFVSFEKPYLFRQNSRPKKIRISYEGESPRVIELADTPNLQYVGVRWPYTSRYSNYFYLYDDYKNLFNKNLWLEILEVYPGTKYSDTCINFLGMEFRK